MARLERKLGLILIILTVLIILGMLGCDNNTDKTEIDQEAIVNQIEVIIPVNIQKVEIQPLEKKIILGGLLKPQEEVVLTGGGAGSKIVNIPVEVGTKVAKGQVILVQDLRDLDLQQNNLEISRSDLQENFDKTMALYTAGAVAESQVTALENQLKQIDLQLENISLTREKMRVTSTINGIVSSLPVVEGQLANASTPVATIVNIDKLLLDLQVGENYIKGIKSGKKLEVNIPSINNNSIIGIVKSLPPTADPRTKSYVVTLEVDNSNHEIKGGMYGEVALVVDSRDNVIAIPQYAIIQRDDKQVVYVVEDQKAKMRVVEVGVTLGDIAEIISGLKEGDQVIVEGQYGVEEDVKVEIINEETTLSTVGQGDAQ